MSSHRNSRLKGREAHSVACFLPMREKYEFLLKWKELFKDLSLNADKNRRFRAIQHAIGLHHLDLVDMLHQCAIETMTAHLCRVGEAKPTKERMLKISRSDLTFRYDSEGRLLEAKLMLIPLKKAIRDRKFGRKVPIITPFDAGPFLKATELLWIMVMTNPCAESALKSTPLFQRLGHRRAAGSSNQVTHDWVVKRYQAKLAVLDPDWGVLNSKLYTIHTPRVVGATTLFAAGCTEAQLKAKGRWSSDIAYIYVRVCPQQERELVRMIASTDATPFLEKGDGHWNAVAHSDTTTDDGGFDSDLDEGNELFEEP